jgi:hypothetical protein
MKGPNVEVEVMSLKRLTKPPKITKYLETDETHSKAEDVLLKIDEEFIPGYDYNKLIKDMKISLKAESIV